MKQLGANIAQYRSRRGLTQETLAEKTDCGRRTIQSIELGERWPRPGTLLKISRELNSPISKLFLNID